MILDLTTKQTGADRIETVNNLKIYWAAHHALFVSDLTDDIAKAVHVNPERLKAWAETDEWKEALSFWGYTASLPITPAATQEEAVEMQSIRKSLALAEKYWTDMIEKGEDLFPPDIPSHPRICAYEMRYVKQIGPEVLRPPLQQSKDFLARMLSRVAAVFIQDVPSFFCRLFTL